MSDWQHIDTAPFKTDKAVGEKWLSRCLLFFETPYGGEILVGQMDAGIWLLPDHEGACADTYPAAPTRWMPLPKKPEPGWMP